MKKCLLFLIFSLWAFSPPVWAQFPFGTGTFLEDESYDELPLQPEYGTKSDLDTLLKVDLKPYCPAIQNQGITNTCTGWSVSYGAYTIQKAIQNDWAGLTGKITENAFSTFFIYNQIKSGEGCEPGTYISEAFKLLEEKGNLLSKQFDGSRDCERQPTEEELEQARKNRIKEFRRLFAKGAAPELKVQAVKQSLRNLKPVVVSLQLKQGFAYVRGQKYWFPKLDNSPLLNMAHAMVVIGYDDGKGAFELMNSWGEDWGDNGFIWIKYEDFAAHCLYAVQFSIRETLETGITYTGQGRCRVPVGVEKGEILFEEVTPSFSKGKYALKAKSWKVGDAFQIVVQGVRPEMYLYAFSYDASDSVKVHWPRDERLDARFDGKQESSIIMGPHVTLIIPGQYLGLQMQKSGREQICLLFSSLPIHDINERLQMVQRPADMSLSQKLELAFSDLLVKSSEIDYAPDEIRFDYFTTEYEHFVAPVLLEMEVKE